MISADLFFTARSEQLAALTLRHAVPAMFSGDRKSVLAGVYAGRILKGDKPGDLPVQQATKVELTVNLKTAKALGLTIPETLLATADEVIQ